MADVTELLPIGGESDDSAQIQTAIDAVDATTDIPGGDGVHGGEVRLGRGTFRITAAPIKLRSGVVLRGTGAGTALAAYDAQATQNIIELDGVGAGTTIARAGIRDLRIVHFGTTSDGASCIAIGTATSVFNCRFENLMLAAPGIALDLSGGITHWSRIRDVIEDPNPGLGNSLIAIDGNNNVIEGVTTNAGVQAGTYATWVNGRPILALKGNNCALRDCYIEPTWGNGQDGYLVDISVPTAQSASGWTWNNNIMEPHLTGTGALTGGFSVKIEDTLLFADNIGFLGGVNGKMSVGDASRVALDLQDITGELTDHFTVNAAAFLMINTMATTKSGGSRDATNVHVTRYLHANQHGGGVIVANTSEVQPANRAPVATQWAVATTGGAVVDDTPDGRSSSIEITDVGTAATITVTITPVGVFNRAQWKVVAPDGVTYVAEDQNGNNYVGTEQDTLTPPQMTPAADSSVIKFTFSNLALGTIDITRVRAWEEKS